MQSLSVAQGAQSVLNESVQYECAVKAQYCHDWQSALFSQGAAHWSRSPDQMHGVAWQSLHEVHAQPGEPGHAAISTALSTPTSAWLAAASV